MENLLAINGGKQVNRNPLVGRPQTKFNSMEEERDYLKAQVKYLKKQYPIFTGRGDSKTESLWDHSWAKTTVSIDLVSRNRWDFSCRLLQMVCSTERKRETRQQRDQILKEHLLAIHRSCPFYGYPRMQVALRKEGFHMNHKRVYFSV